MNALLHQTKQLQEEVENYEDNDIPTAIRDTKALHPYYRLVRQDLKEKASPEQMLQIVQYIGEVLQKERIVDWKTSIEVKRAVRDQLEDFLFDVVKKEMKIPLSVEFIENFINNVWNLATKND